MLLSLQACRGDGLDDGVEVDSAADTSSECSFPQHLSVPVDTAVMYATAPGRLNSQHLLQLQLNWFITLKSVILQSIAMLLIQRDVIRCTKYTKATTTGGERNLQLQGVDDVSVKY